MSHEITKTDGLALAKTKAWHGLGIVLPDTFTIEEGLKVAGLEWNVDQTPLYTMIERDGEMVRVPVESHVCNVRADTNKILSVVGSGYKPVQNRELAEFIMKIADNVDGVRLESCGSIRGGERVWFLAKTDTVIEVGKGDEVIPYVNFANGHDGTLSCWIIPTAVRVVCKNTMDASIIGLDKRERSGTAFNFRHTATIDERIAGARKAIERSLKGLDKFEEGVKVMAATEFESRDKVLDFYKSVFEATWWKIPTEIKSAKDERKRDKATNIVAQWLANMEGERQTSFGIDGTVWAAMNSVTEYADHEKTVRASNGVSKEDARIYSNLWGSSAKLKANAMSEAVALIKS